MFFNIKKNLNIFSEKIDEIKKEMKSLKITYLELNKIFLEIKKINRASL
ncbi:hypothetical protein Q4936_001807, partial [Campylobacter coli]|nr:hypothetical protein [Campylobacter coli]